MALPVVPVTNIRYVLEMVKHLKRSESVAGECQKVIFHISESHVASLQYKLKRDDMQYVFFVRKI